MTDFSDRPLAAGSLVGSRAFRVDSLGRLTGHQHTTVFKPSENEAVCFAGPAASVEAQIEAMMRIGRPLTALPPSRRPTPVKHPVGALRCQCGFYAYFDGRPNTYADEGTVTGIVEGYGTCTVGSRGFRASKARLVALIDPPPPSRRRGSRLPLTSSVISSLAAVLNIAAAITTHGLVKHLVYAAVGVAMVALTAWNLHRVKVERTRSAAAPTIPFDLVRRNYPDVPVYPTLAAAVAAHPLTMPVPPTPDEPDFWERKA